MIFSFVESNNFHHLCVFDLITGLKQAKNLLGNLVIFRLNPERSDLFADISHYTIMGLLATHALYKPRILILFQARFLIGLS